MEASFRERAVTVRRLWRSDSTAFVVVTAPRPDTVAESGRFSDQLAAAGIDTDLVIANRCSPAVGVEAGADPWSPVALDADPVDRARALADWAARLYRAESDALAQLGDPLRIDRIPGDVHDLETLSVLADAIGT